METFFSGNGYTVIDRTAINSGEISFENIWGVADEDLFRLAIASSTSVTPRASRSSRTS